MVHPVLGVGSGGLTAGAVHLWIIRCETCGQIDRGGEVLLVEQVSAPQGDGRVAVRQHPGQTPVHQPVGLLFRRVHRFECVVGAAFLRPAELCRDVAAAVYMKV